VAFDKDKGTDAPWDSEVDWGGRTLAIVIVVLVGVVVVLVPVVPGQVRSSRTMTCGGQPFPCKLVEYNRVPSQGIVMYRLFWSLSDWVFGFGIVCSPDIGGCWFAT